MRSMPWPLEEARILFEYGLLFIQKGDQDQARERLKEALAIYRWLGARPYAMWVERTLEELS